MITRKLLLESGYIQWTVNKTFKPYAELLFQKRITDELGTKYFINSYEYRFDDVPNYPNPLKVSYTFEVNFTLLNDERANVHYLYNSTKTLEEIELFFKNCFIKLNCVHYDLD